MNEVDVDHSAPISDVERAARLIYLNKTCFNGVWRVNGAGNFNVPIGDVKDPVICDEPNLRACSEALQSVELHWEDFSKVGGRVTPGDLVYFDPPYAPVSPTAKFTSYTRGNFGQDDHERMMRTARTMKASGVNVVISNSDSPIVHKIYDGNEFELMPVQAPRSVAARGASRGKVTELVIR